MTIANEQVPGVYRRRVGKVLVTALNDGLLMLPPEVLLDITPEDRESLLREAGRRPPFHTAINTFLLQWPDRTVLMDSGVGPAWGPKSGKLAANMKAAGVAAGDVDAVMLTHLHGDHIGGLCDPAGGAAFPKAELWVAETEMAFWEDDAKKAAAPEARRSSFDSARTAVAPYAGKLRRFGFGEIMPGLEAIAMPGHTPGHTGYMLSSGGERLLIVADVFHVPEVQAARPEVGVGFDNDPAQAIRTRRTVLQRAVDEDLLVTGMHMSFPGFSRIARAGDGYVIHPEAWSGDL
jgi:glyoxylase-like metal-dependent hydrolase (beta-lactamase superfamily II)